MNQIDPMTASAVVIALCALGVSLWQGYLQRRHNILSVKPRLEFVLKAMLSEPVSIALVNNGLGPAILVSLQATYQGKTVNLSTHQELVGFAKEIFDGLRGSIESCAMQHEYTLAQGEHVPFISLSLASNELGQVKVAETAIHNVGLSVTYKCMYGVVYSSSHIAALPHNHSVRDFPSTPK